jgi:hypothetical protein
VTLGGPRLALSSVDPTQLVATADVTGLPAGTRNITVTFQPPAGLNVVALDPTQVTVTVAAPPPSPAVPPSAIPSP